MKPFKTTKKISILWFMLWKLIRPEKFRPYTLCDLMNRSGHGKCSPTAVGIAMPAWVLVELEKDKRSFSRRDWVPEYYLWWPLDRKGNRARIRAVIAAMFRALWQLTKHVFTFQWTYGL